MCGIVGVFNVGKPFSVTSDMMTALQYRGEQGAGIALAKKDGNFFYERTLGLNLELSGKIENLHLNESDYFAGIGHLRYGTSGSRRSLENAQPLHCKTSWGEIYIGHNGDTPYFNEMKASLSEQGRVFLTDSDTEFILHHIGLSKEADPITAIKHGLRSYKGTYAIVMLVETAQGVKLIAARDPSGNRPLTLGKLDGGYIVASENSAFETVNGEFIREIRPNELLVISGAGIEKHHIEPMLVIDTARVKFHQCIFENIYFSFPSSNVFGIPVDLFREELGQKAARRYGHLIGGDDIVTNPPDSSNFFIDGFCKELKRQPEKVFLRRHSIKIRSFTQESEETRDAAIRRKFSIRGHLVTGKRVWLLDDSVVRGKTSKKLVRSLRNNGAVWVGVLSSCPPIIGPCHKGIDMTDDLIAAKHMKDGQVDIEGIRKEIEADFVGYLTFEDVFEVISSFRLNPENFCFGCFQNREPIWHKW